MRDGGDVPTAEWEKDLEWGKRAPLPTVANVMLVVGHDPQLAGLVAYDEFAHGVVVTRAPPLVFDGGTPCVGPYPRPIDDNDTTLIQGHVQRSRKMLVGQQVTQQAIAAVAMQRRSHPVRDYLDGLAWDGRPRIDDWLHLAFGTPGTSYNTAVGAKFLCAAVRRIRHPGTKFDHVMVLEGPQGTGKSRACEALFAPYFTDNLPMDLGSKDAQQAMAGKWGVELAELQSLIKTGSQVAKAFFSRRIDYFRPPYGRLFIEQPRQCVFIGSTNDHDWLTDSTGNRRYWPVRCVKVEPGWITDHRDQLWAEACEREAEGETLWLDDAVVERFAVVEQVERTTEDVWTPDVRRFLLNQPGAELSLVTVSQILIGMGLAADRRNRVAEMRVAAILRIDGWASGMTYDPRTRKQFRAWKGPGWTPLAEGHGREG